MEGVSESLAMGPLALQVRMISVYPSRHHGQIDLLCMEPLQQIGPSGPNPAADVFPGPASFARAIEDGHLLFVDPLLPHLSGKSGLEPSMLPPAGKTDQDHYERQQRHPLDGSGEQHLEELDTLHGRFREEVYEGRVP